MSKYGKVKDSDEPQLRALAVTAEARYEKRAARMLKEPKVRQYIDEYADKARAEVVKSKTKKAG